MKFLNLMRNKLIPKEVNDALESIIPLPNVSASDNGKTLQVVGGVWSIGNKMPDSVTPNPEGMATTILEKVQVGETIYSVGGELVEETITYTGTGNTTNVIEVIKKPKYISGFGFGSDNADLLMPVTPIDSKTVGVFYPNGILHDSMTYNDETKRITLVSNGMDAGWCLNAEGKSYTIKLLY